MNSPIRIGEINSYSAPALIGFTTAYKKGLEFALARINAAGGVLGRPIEILFRDDGFIPEDAARHAETLIRDEKVDLIMGTFNSDVALAVAAVADREKTLFWAGEPRSDALVWEPGSRYVFRLRTTQSMMTKMLVERVAAMPQRRWGLVGTTYPAGLRFQKVMKDAFAVARPDIEWIGECIHDMKGYRFDVERTLDWIDEVKPEALFAPVLGPDMVTFAREGNRRGTWSRCVIVNPLAGEPEYMLPLGADAPENWLVLGYPGEDDPRPANQKFCADFRAWSGEAPTLGVLLGEMLLTMLVQAIERAGSTETEAMCTAFEGLESDTPMGRIRIRTDHQSTMGGWVGMLTRRDGQAAMRDWEFCEGSRFLPSEEEGMAMRSLRPALG